MVQNSRSSVYCFKLSFYVFLPIINSEVTVMENSCSLMARKLSVLVSAVMVGAVLVTGGTVSAKSSVHEETVLSATQEIKLANVKIDGVLQKFDQSAIVKDGSTLVPLRGVFEGLGAKVEWNQVTQTVTGTKGSTVIKLTVGKSTATVNGKIVTLSAKAEIINGSTMVPLRFIAEALGAKVEWEAPTYTAVITSSGGSSVVTPTPTPKPVEESATVNGIKVQYGKHTYGSKNQKEYDKVMEIVNAKVANIDSVKLDQGGKYEGLFEAYLYKGDRADNYSYGSTEHRGLTLAHGVFSPLLEEGLTVDEAVHVYKVSLLASSFMGDVTNPRTGSPKSAYDNLVNKISDCDSDAQVYSAVFDAMGYNSAIVAGTNHADVVIKVGNNWYVTMSGQFSKANVTKALEKGATMLAQPTYGAELKK